MILMAFLVVACSGSGEQVDDSTSADTAEGTLVDFVADREVERLTIETESGDLLTFRG